MFDRLQASLFKKKINSNFSEYIKNIISSNGELRKRYMNFSFEINSIFSKYGYSDIVCENILLALKNNCMSQLIVLLNDSLLSSVVLSNTLSFDEVMFLFNNKEKLKSSDLDNYMELSKLDVESLNNYFNFSYSGINKENVPLCFFKANVYEKIVSNTDFNFFEYINNLIIKYSNSEFMINKIISLIDDGFDNFCQYISMKKHIDFNFNFDIFKDKYFNKIGLDNLLDLDLSNEKEVSNIMLLVESDKNSLLDDYLLCKSNNIITGEINDDINNIFELIINVSDKKRFLYLKLFGVNEVSSIMEQILDGYISFDCLNSELISKYEPLISFITKINNCSSDSDFNRLNCIISRNRLEYSKYFQMMEEDLNKNNAQIMVDMVSSVKEFESKSLGLHVEDGINIIDFEGEPFNMLVHGVYQRSEKSYDEVIDKRFNEFDGCISTSLISDKHMHFYKTNQLVFLGYNDLKANQIASSRSKDSGTVNFYQKDRTNISLPKQIFDENGDSYNEVVINTLDGVQRPNYVLCFNEVDDISKEVAKKYGLPIYLIHTVKYPGASIDGNLMVFNDESSLSMDLNEYDKDNYSL